MQDVTHPIWMVMVFLLKTAMDSIKATSDFTIMDADMVSKLLTSLRREARKKGLVLMTPLLLMTQIITG